MAHNEFQDVHWPIVIFNFDQYNFSGGQDLALSQFTSLFLTPSIAKLSWKNSFKSYLHVDLNI